MKHAISELTRAAETLEHNAAVNHREAAEAAQTGDARLAKAQELRAAIKILSVYGANVKTITESGVITNHGSRLSKGELLRVG